MPPAHHLIKDAEKPTVLIIGAGLAGAMLAILLEKANVPYILFERATEVKTLGAAIYLGPNVAAVLKQIGVYDEFISKSILCNSINVFNENRQSSFVMDFSEFGVLGGFDGYLLPRSVLYDIFLNQIPPEKIRWGKKVLSLMQNANGVMIRFSDGSTVDGDILVGADGAYSGVRQSMYKQLAKAGKLPDSDAEGLPYSCACLVGQTLPLDPEKFRELKDPVCHFDNILAQDRPYSWATFTTKDNIMCWQVNQYLDRTSSKTNDSFRNSEWGSEAAEAMCKEVRDFPIVGGDGTLTLGDLIDNTPKERISKVMLEVKVFDTWHYGRTVLIGDACHKINPAGGQGGITAIHDAIALANWINTLTSTSIDDIKTIFKEYKAERFEPAKAAFTHGQGMGQVSARTMSARLTRFITKNMPRWLWRMILVKNAANRPQVSFLPLIEDKGTVKPQDQPSLRKTLEILRAREEAAKADETGLATAM
ncbi:hypothetical protein BG011_008634 [Mortierella polycephala]|uniref:FAD-binding domain-containing protein n=1 Tax=Mortierella polycephala TaxID=41804 RepID=A0A9P6PNM5_9FUNG|nr:hypothetical protein BG011_008634 [Mortierella polycephala]